MDERKKMLFARITNMAPGLAGAAVIFVGMVVLVGWAVKGPEESAAASGTVPVKAATAATFVIAGSAMLFLRYRNEAPWKYRLGRVLAFLTLLLGCLTLIGYTFGWHYCIDHLLLGLPRGEEGTLYPGSIPLFASLNFILIGMSLLLLGSKSTKVIHAAQIFVILEGAIAFTALAGYSGGISVFDRGIGTVMAMSPPIAGSFILICFGVLLMRPAAGILPLFSGERLGSKMIRIVFPVSLLFPLLFFWLVLAGVEAYYYNAEFGMLLLAMGIAGVGVFTIHRGAVIINAIEAKREKAVESLRSSEELVKSVFDSSPAGIMAFRSVRNTAGEIVDFEVQMVNPSAEKTLNPSPGNFVGKRLLQETLVPDGEDLFRRLLDVVTTGVPAQQLYLYEQGNRRMWLQAAAVKLGDGFVVTFLDVTALKKAELQLLEFNRLYSVLSGINQMIIRTHDFQELFDEACRIIVEKGMFTMAWIGLIDHHTGMVKAVACHGCNAGYLDGLKLSVDENNPWGRGPTGSALREQKHFVCNDIERDERMLPWREEALKRGYRASAAFPFIVGGRVEGSLNLYADRAGVFDEKEIGLLQELASDISFAISSIKQERTNKLQEEELMRLSLAVQASGEVIFTTDREGVITAVNPEFTRVYGYAAGDVVGKATPRIIKSGLLPAEAYAAFWDTLLNKQVVKGEIVNKARDGRIITVEGSANPIINAKGDIVGFLAIQHDITDRKKAEEDQRKLQSQVFQMQRIETVGTLAGGIAHDFNNILAIIQGNAELALQALKPGEALYEALNEELKEIHDASRQASGIVRQLLLFSRRQKERKVTAVSLGSTIRNMTRMLHRLIREDIVISTIFDEGLWTIQGNEGNIEQVIMNLAINARDAMPSGGKLIIKAENVVIDDAAFINHPDARTGRYVRLTVEDTGTGIDGETLKHVFEPFFTTKEPGHGSGLGLSVVYGIVHQHNGWIGVYSDPNRGTRFSAYFPAAAEEPADRGEATVDMSRLQGNGRRILFVDDEPAIRSVVAKLLSRHGYVVFSAGSINEAFALFEKEQGNFDVLFSDVLLPDGKGHTLAWELQLRKPGLKVLLGSGYIDEAFKEMEDLSKFHRLQKPYTGLVILETLYSLLS